MSLYETLLWLHVTAAVLWVGGSAAVVVLAFVAARSVDLGARAYLARSAATLGGRYLSPLAGIAGLLGIGLVIESAAWEFSEFWVSASLAIWLLSAIMGGAVIGRQADALVAAINEAATFTESMRPDFDRLLLFARIDVLTLLVVIFLITTKPGA